MPRESKPNGLTVILGVGKGKPSGKRKGDGSDAKELKKGAAKALLSALDAKDPEAVADAFSDMIDACSDAYSDDDDENEQDDKDDTAYGA